MSGSPTKGTGDKARSNGGEGDGTLVRSELATWGKIIKEIGIASQ
jgi:hypothetical protein